MILSPYSDYVDSANLLLPTVSAMSIMELVSIYPSHLGRGREAVATVIPYYTLKPSLYSTITPPHEQGAGWSTGDAERNSISTSRGILLNYHTT